MLDKELEQTLNQAFREARGNNHEFMTVEHLLLALLDNEVSRDILIACGADLPALKTELSTFLQETVPLLPPNDDRDTQPTLGFQRVLQRAVFHVQSSGKQEVSAANVLVAIFSEQESQAVSSLRNKISVVWRSLISFRMVLIDCHQMRKWMKKLNWAMMSRKRKQTRSQNTPQTSMSLQSQGK